MNIDYNMVMAMTGIVAIIISLWALRSESKRSRFSLGLEIILKMEERFNGEEMKKARRTAAKALIENKNFDATDDVIDFFEMIGLLTRKGTIDSQMVWFNFFYWIHRYINAAKAHIEAEQKKDCTVWTEILHLHKQLLDIERSERNCTEKQLHLSKSEIVKFLNEEANL